MLMAMQPRIHDAVPMATGPCSYRHQHPPPKRGQPAAATPAGQETVVWQARDLPCDVRREGGHSLVIGGSSLVMLEGRKGNPL